MFLFLLGRVLLGGFFIMNGYQHFKNLEMLTGYAKSKGVPMAKESVFLTGVMMLIGGIGILSWMWVGLSALLLSVFLLVVTFKMHRYWIIADPVQQMGERVNFYKNLALLGALLILVSSSLY